MLHTSLSSSKLNLHYFKTYWFDLPYLLQQDVRQSLPDVSTATFQQRTLSAWRGSKRRPYWFCAWSAQWRLQSLGAGKSRAIGDRNAQHKVETTNRSSRRDGEKWGLCNVALDVQLKSKLDLTLYDRNTYLFTRCHFWVVRSQTETQGGRRPTKRLWD